MSLLSCPTNYYVDSIHLCASMHVACPFMQLLVLQMVGKYLIRISYNAQFTVLFFLLSLVHMIKMFCGQL